MYSYYRCDGGAYRKPNVAVQTVILTKHYIIVYHCHKVDDLASMHMCTLMPSLCVRHFALARHPAFSFILGSWASGDCRLCHDPPVLPSLVRL